MSRSLRTTVTAALVAFAGVGAFSVSGVAGAGTRETPWSRARKPSSDRAEAIGEYGAGCIAGAVALPLRGKGYRVAHPERRRVFGHPNLIALIGDLGGRVDQLGIGPLAIGDLGQPRGGPALTGHASHQTGLDVDIFFLPLVDGAARSLVDAAEKKPSPLFTKRIVRELEATATDPRVDRIFVNPVLKRALCEDPNRGAWLQKLRPWWGHDDHFHVRLSCPKDSPDCVAQPPLPPGDGCDDSLAWWFRDDADADRVGERSGYAARVGSAPHMPDRCASLVQPAAN